MSVSSKDINMIVLNKNKKAVNVMTIVITFLFAGSLTLLFADYGQDKYYVCRIIIFLQILINYLYVISIIRYSNISYSAGELCYKKFFMQKKSYLLI